MATAESARLVLLSHLAKSAKRFCVLKDVQDLFSKWYLSLEVEVPAALLLHMTRYSIFSNSSIILPRLQAIGVTQSYSSRPFLCVLGIAIHSRGSYKQLKVGTMVVYLLHSLWCRHDESCSVCIMSQC